MEGGLVVGGGRARGAGMDCGCVWVVILGGVEIDLTGVFWGVGAFFRIGWCGYTGKSFLPLYVH